MRYACFGLGGYMPFVVPPATHLKYRLEKAEDALVFQVIDQSPDITTFLKRYNFMATNGLKVAIDKYPEFKLSKNTIFLRGSDAKEAFKLDTTRFAGRVYRDGAASLFNEALKELVDCVKGTKTAVPYGKTFFGPWAGGNKMDNTKTSIVIVQ